MNPHGRRLRARLWLAVIVLIAALVLLVISILPEMRYQQVLPMPPVVLPTPTPTSRLIFWKGVEMMRARVGSLLLLVFVIFALAGCGSPVVHLPTPTQMNQASGAPTPVPGATPQPRLLEKRLLILEWPQMVREKDTALIELTLAMNEQGQITATAHPGGTPVEIPNIYDTHNIVAVARLDMAGVEAYREDIREPLRPGEPVTFTWSIRADEAGTYRGVVWLRLELVPKNGGQIEEMLLLARTIEIQAVTVLGLSGSLARILGGAGLILSTALGYPFIQNWVAGWLKRRRGKGQPPKSQSQEVSKPEK